MGFFSKLFTKKENGKLPESLENAFRELSQGSKDIDRNAVRLRNYYQSISLQTNIVDRGLLKSFDQYRNILDCLAGFYKRSGLTQPSMKSFDADEIKNVMIEQYDPTITTEFFSDEDVLSLSNAVCIAILKNQEVMDKGTFIKGMVEAANAVKETNCFGGKHSFLYGLYIFA